MSKPFERSTWESISHWLKLEYVPQNELIRFKAYYDDCAWENTYGMRQEGTREVAAFVLAEDHSLGNLERIFREHFQELTSRQHLRRHLEDQGARYHLYHGPEGYLGGFEIPLLQLAFAGLPHDDPAFIEREDVKQDFIESHRLGREAASFLFSHVANPYSPCQYLVPVLLECMKLSTWNYTNDGIPLDLFNLLVHFVEPRPSSEQPSPARRFRDAMYEGLLALGREDINEAIAMCQSPLGRFYPDPDWEGIGWNDRLSWIHPEDENGTVSFNLFEPRVVHGGDGHDAMAKLATIYDELEFSKTSWDPTRVVNVDLNGVVSEAFKAEFGLGVDDALRGAWYRIDTTGKFQCSDTEESELYIDVFAFDTSAADNVPSLLVLPRFGAFYTLRNPLFSSGLNERLARRTLQEKHGIVLRRYRPSLVVTGERNLDVIEPLVQAFEAQDPYFPATYFPTDPMLPAEDSSFYPPMAN